MRQQFEEEVQFQAPSQDLTESEEDVKSKYLNNNHAQMVLRSLVCLSEENEKRRSKKGRRKANEKISFNEIFKFMDKNDKHAAEDGYVYVIPTIPELKNLLRDFANDFIIRAVRGQNLCWEVSSLNVRRYFDSSDDECYFSNISSYDERVIMSDDEIISTTSDDSEQEQEDNNTEEWVPRNRINQTRRRLCYDSPDIVSGVKRRRSQRMRRVSSAESTKND